MRDKACDASTRALTSAMKTRLLTDAKNRGVMADFLGWLREHLRGGPQDGPIPAHYYLWAAGQLQDFPCDPKQLDRCVIASPRSAIAYAAHVLTPDQLAWCKDNR